jgi:hypothetical protein
MDIVEAMLSRAQRLAKEPVGVGDPGPAGGGARGSKRRGHAVLKAVLLGGVVALAAKPEVRNRLLDALFGPEEQFEYESVTEPVAAPIASKPPAPAQEPSSDGGEGAAPAGETSWYRSWDSPSGATSDAPAAAAPAPMYERWSHSEGDQAPSRDGASAPVDDDGESAKASAPRYDAWSRIEDEAATAASSEDSAVPDRAIWSRLEDTPAPPREPPSAVPVSGAEDATTTTEETSGQEPADPAGVGSPAPDSVTAAAQDPDGGQGVQDPDGGQGAGDPADGEVVQDPAGGQGAGDPAGGEVVQDPDGSEATQESAGGEEEPAIGEADSHRNGWWMRRRRTEPASDSPSVD